MFLSHGRLPLGPVRGTSSIEAALLSNPFVMGMSHATGYQIAQGAMRASSRSNTLPLMLHVAAGMSYLEATYVLDSTRRNYKARLMDFLLWAANRRLDWHDAAGLDQTLLVLFDELFFKGFAVGDASSYWPPSSSTIHVTIE